MGVASLADAGVASLADAGAAFLADLAGSVAGEVTDLTAPVEVGSDEMTFPQECGVRGCSVFGDTMYCETDCVGWETPSVWCHDIIGVWGDSGYEL